MMTVMISVIFALCIYIIIGIVLYGMYLFKKIDTDTNEEIIASRMIIFNWFTLLLIFIFK